MFVKSLRKKICEIPVIYNGMDRILLNKVTKKIMGMESYSTLKKMNLGTFYRFKYNSDINRDLVKWSKERDYEKISAYYEETSSPEGSSTDEMYYDEYYSHRMDLRLIDNLLTRYGRNKRKYKVCDLACGHGQLILMLNQKGHRVAGIDLSGKRVDFLRDQGLEVQCRDMDHTGFKSECFDVVLCLHCLEHVVDLKASLMEAYRILKSSGIIMIAVPNEYEIDDPSHIRIFDKKSLISIVQQNGMHVLFISAIPYLNYSNKNSLFLIAAKNKNNILSRKV